MKNTSTTSKKEHQASATVESQKVNDSHKKVADHFEAAAKSHNEAAKHQKNGNHEKATNNTVEAKKHANPAHEAPKKDAKHHSSKA